MKICAHCDRTILAKGLCGKHYAAAWYASHPERSREIARNAYHAKNPAAKTRAEIAAARPVRCLICAKSQVIAKGLCRNCYRNKFQREKDIASKRVRRAKDPAKTRAEARASYARNRTKARAATDAWWAAHPEAQRIKDATRRARKAGARGRYSLQDIARLLLLQRGRCAVCCVELTWQHHRDHVMPLALGGSNEITNIQLLCPPCNQSKHHRHPVEFMQSRGFLV